MSTPQSRRLSTKPSATTSVTPEQEQWINSRNELDHKPAAVSKPEKTKRITFDVSESQHRAIKMLASQKGMTVRELMTELVEQILES